MSTRGRHGPWGALGRRLAAASDEEPDEVGDRTVRAGECGLISDGEGMRFVMPQPASEEEAADGPPSHVLFLAAVFARVAADPGWTGELLGWLEDRVDEAEARGGRRHDA